MYKQKGGIKMKNLNIRKVLLPVATSLVLISSACTNEETKTLETSIEKNIEIETETEAQAETQTEPTIETDISENTTNQEESFDNFTTEKEEISTLINKDDFEKAKEKGTEFFITAVDFIFYDAEYKNITFDELTDEAKKETYDNLCIIDGWIMNIAPNYKENLGEKWQLVKDFTSEKYYFALDKIKEYISEENYNAVKEFKDNAKTTIKDGWEKTKEKVKTKADDWYQQFKNDHE